MWSAEMEARWRALSEEVFTGMAACRVHHPRAMLGEIEAALDEWLATVQARMQPGGAGHGPLLLLAPGGSRDVRAPGAGGDVARMPIGPARCA